MYEGVYISVRLCEWMCLFPPSFVQRNCLRPAFVMMLLLLLLFCGGRFLGFVFILFCFSFFFSFFFLSICLFLVFGGFFLLSYGVFCLFVIFCWGGIFFVLFCFGFFFSTLVVVVNFKWILFSTFLERMCYANLRNASCFITGYQWDRHVEP